MFKLYNTQKEIASNLKLFLLNAIPDSVSIYSPNKR